MIDARLLFDVHFQQGKRKQEPLVSPAHAEERSQPTAKQTPKEETLTPQETPATLEQDAQDAQPTPAKKDDKP